MHVNYFGVHAELCHSLLSVYGFDEETLNQHHIYLPLITLSSPETKATLWRSILQHQEELQVVLLSNEDYGVKFLLYVLQELCEACKDKVGCLYDDVEEGTLQAAWEHVKTNVIPSLSDEKCVITFGAVFPE
ncbi:hypothetical protein P3553_10485 [Vibrio parahaemolyticus]|uniref:hypothetical protein n=1 Tax=Vibrio parahaemolyticus TaxID=670 RepID=UPI001A902E06|nr:hypothetical protein [Vibrio parahaemolyticus]MBO0167122.1 hypothetical protein [Vibrio parahaemolyticus]MDF4752526.1 hypothetical protein [Vibrio parahaemolyticus]MDF4778640.1 hypothetical protein [Vibrio parahaemolyticus]MDF4783657.1 hypothetical protein [Vibrio parahaemolyticus]MDF4794483.1 hypothetical protein [Vibrio parahaemolyticus]